MIPLFERFSGFARVFSGTAKEHSGERQTLEHALRDTDNLQRQYGPIGNSLDDPSFKVADTYRWSLPAKGETERHLDIVLLKKINDRSEDIELKARIYVSFDGAPHSRIAPLEIVKLYGKHDAITDDTIKNLLQDAVKQNFETLITVLNLDPAKQDARKTVRTVPSVRLPS